MAATSINFHLRPSAREGRHTGKLFIRIIRARQTRQIPTGYAIYADEWDAQGKRIIFPPADTAQQRDRQHRLSIIAESVAGDLKRLRQIVSLLEENGDYSAADVVERFLESQNPNTVFGYAEISANRLREEGKERTAQAYRSAARSLMDFAGGKDVLLSEIDAPLMAGYEQHLIRKGLKMNTVSFYLRNLRAVYFRAIADKIIAEQTVNPFAGLHTGVYETKRRALDSGQLQSLAALEDSLLERMEALAKPAGSGSGNREPIVDEIRKASGLLDCLLIFLFCYHARGMSFVDMAYLKRANIDGEILTYKRRKTGGTLEIKVTEPMRKILLYFAQRTEGSEYVFPVIDPSRGNIRQQYETGLKRQNHLLKTLAKMAGITETLSTHAARHTWATLAKRMQFPVAVIGEALGHRDVKTTSIYLASFDRATMDELSARLSEAAKAA